MQLFSLQSNEMGFGLMLAEGAGSGDCAALNRQKHQD